MSKMVLSRVDEDAVNWAPSRTVNGYDLAGGQVSNLDKKLLDGHNITPVNSSRGDRDEHKDERVRAVFLREDPENDSVRCPEAKGLSGQGSLGKAASCRMFLKIPKAYWHTKDSKKTCK